MIFTFNMISVQWLNTVYTKNKRRKYLLTQTCKANTSLHNGLLVVNRSTYLFKAVKVEFSFAREIKELLLLYYFFAGGLFRFSKCGC
jgi:hypothetical protein